MTTLCDRLTACLALIGVGALAAQACGGADRNDLFEETSSGGSGGATAGTAGAGGVGPSGGVGGGPDPDAGVAGFGGSLGGSSGSGGFDAGSFGGAGGASVGGASGFGGSGAAGFGGSSAGGSAGASTGGSGAAPSGVACDGASCAVGAEFCCVPLGPFGDSCRSLGSSCNQGTEIYCDGPEDCAAGEACCGFQVQLAPGVSAYNELRCSTTCDLGQQQVVVCGGHQDACPVGTCGPSMLLPAGYTVCRP